MKKYRKTDKIIKNKLGHYASEAPMHLFDRIDAQRKLEQAADPKRRIGGWWFVLLGLVVAGGVSMYLVYNNASTELASEDLSISTTNSENYLEQKEILNQQNNSVEAALQIENSSNLFNDENSDATVSNSDLTTKTQTTKTILSKENQKFSNDKKEATLKTVLMPTAQPDQWTTKGGAPIAENISNIPADQKSENTLLKDKEALAVGVSDRLGKTNFGRLSFEKIAALDFDHVPSKIGLFKEKRSSGYDLDIDPKCGLKEGKNFLKLNKSVDIFASPDYAFRILEYKSDEYADYAVERNDTEKRFYSFNTGVRFNFLTDYNWAFRTGLVYTQINEIFKTQYMVTVIKTDPVTNDTLGFTQELLNATIFNRYRMVDVPVLFSYEIPMKKVTFNINSGVYVNISSTQKGSFLAPDGDQSVEFTSSNPDGYHAFKKNIGFSLFTGLGINYPLTDKLQLIIEPHVRYYPKSIAKDQYVLNQKYLVGGLMIGLRKDLGFRKGL